MLDSEGHFFADETLWNFVLKLLLRISLNLSDPGVVRSVNAVECTTHIY